MACSFEAVPALLRREEEPASGFAHGFGSGDILGRREVVQDDNRFGVQFWDQLDTRINPPILHE